MFFRVFLLTLALCLPASLLMAVEQGPFIDQGKVIQSISLSAADINAGQEASMEVNMPVPTTFVLKRDTPNGTKIAAYYGDSGENLGQNLPAGMAGFNEYGDIEDGFVVQVAAVDLDADGVPEIIVASGDQAAILTATVFVFKAEPDEHGARFANAGLIEAQNKLEIGQDGSIMAPYGSQGLFSQYRLKDSQLEKVE